MTAAGGNLYISSGIRACSGGWYRIWVTYTSAAAPLSGTAFGLFGLITGAERYDGSYTAVGNETFYLYGNQIEAGSFPTSYIPTTSSAATRSRDGLHAGDTNTVTVSSWTSSTEETNYVHAQQFAVSSNAPRLYEYDTNNNSSLAIVSSSQVNQQYSVGGVTQAEFISTITAFEEVKAAIAAKFNDFAASVNGLATLTDNSGSFAKRVSIKFGNSTANNRPLNGHIREFRYYPTRVTDLELQRITTP